jgi:hypothetical protein
VKIEPDRIDIILLALAAVLIISVGLFAIMLFDLAGTF